MNTKEVPLELELKDMNTKEVPLDKLRTLLRHHFHYEEFCQLMRTYLKLLDVPNASTVELETIRDGFRNIIARIDDPELDDSFWCGAEVTLDEDQKE